MTNPLAAPVRVRFSVRVRVNVRVRARVGVSARVGMGGVKVMVRPWVRRVSVRV